jgi:hypothetical protein
MEYGIHQGYNPLTSTAYASQPYASQFGQPPTFGGAPGPFGGAAAAPFSGLTGSGIGGLFGGQNIGRQPGQVIDGVGGMFQTSPNVDPLAAAQIQQVQLLQQLQLAQQQVAQLVQQAQLAQQIAQQQQLGRVSPLGIDPITAAIVQQRALMGQQAGLFNNPLNNPLSRIDPITAAYVQQAQVAQLCQQLGQQAQLGSPFGHSHYGAGQFGPVWAGAGQNLWANPQLAQFGRNPQYGAGFGGQLPIY